MAIKKYRETFLNATSARENILHNALLNDVYKKEGDWFVDGSFKIKFNKQSVTMKSEKGTQLIYMNPKKVTVDLLGQIIGRAMV